MATATIQIWRGDRQTGQFRDYSTEVSEGMVVLDAIHRIQAEQAPDLAVRWSCKAGKCSSCSAEINGMPKLMCMTRLSKLRLDEPVTVEPMKAFPPIKDLVADDSDEPVLCPLESLGAKTSRGWRRTHVRAEAPLP